MRIDNKYNNLLKEILSNGFDYDDPNRQKVKRRQITHHRIEHNFEEGFPILQTKKVFWRGAINELKAFLSGYTDVRKLKQLKINFWDKDVANFNQCKVEDVNEHYDMGKIYSYQMRNWQGEFDQIQNLIKTLRENHYATKKIVTMWNPLEVYNQEMCLSPCHWSFEALVDGDKNLTIKWNQASTDVFLGLPINIIYYSTLCYILARLTGLNPKGIIGDLTNVHIYHNHFESVFEQIIEFDTKKEYQEPYLSIKQHVDFFNLETFLETFNTSTIQIVNYNVDKIIKAEMLAYDKV